MLICSFACAILSQNHLNSIPEHRVALLGFSSSKIFELLATNPESVISDSLRSKLKGALRKERDILARKMSLEYGKKSKNMQKGKTFQM